MKCHLRKEIGYERKERSLSNIFNSCGLNLIHTSAEIPNTAAYKDSIAFPAQQYIFNDEHFDDILPLTKLAL